MLVVHAASCCDVCLEQYWEENEDSSVKTPYAIACGHVFCKTCLESTDPALCPLCRRRYRHDHIKKLHVEAPDVTDEDIENGFLQKVLLTWDDEGGIGEVNVQIDEWLSTKTSSFGVALRRIKMLQDQFAELRNSCADMRRKHDDDRYKINVLRAKLKHRDDTMVHENHLNMVHQENLNEYVEVLKKKVQEQQEEISTLRTQLETMPRMPEYTPASPPPFSYPYPPQQYPPRRDSLPPDVRPEEGAPMDYSRDKGKGREVAPVEPRYDAYLPNTLASNPLPAPPVPSTYTNTEASDTSSTWDQVPSSAVQPARIDVSTFDPSSSAAGPSGYYHYSNAAGPSSIPTTNGHVSDQYQTSYSQPTPTPYSATQYYQSSQTPQTNGAGSSSAVPGYVSSSNPSHSLSIAMQEAQQQRSSPPRRVRVVSGAPDEQRVAPDVPYVRQGDVYRDPLAPIIEEVSSDATGSSRKKISDERRRRKKKRDTQPEVSDQEARESWTRKASERETMLGVTGLGLLDEDDTPVASNARAAAVKDGYEQAYKEALNYASSARTTAASVPANGSLGTNNVGATISGTGKIQQIHPRRQVPSAAMHPQMTQARQKAAPLPPSFNRQTGRHDDTTSILSGLSTRTWGSLLSTRSAGSDLFNHLTMFSGAHDANGIQPWEVSVNDPHAFLPPRTAQENNSSQNSNSSSHPHARRSSTATGGPTMPPMESRRPSTSSTARPPTMVHSATMPDISTLQLSHSEDRRRDRDRDRDSDRERRRSSRRSSTRTSSQAQVQDQYPVQSHPIAAAVEVPSLPDGNALGLNLHANPEPTPTPRIVAPIPITPHDMFLRSFSNDAVDSGRRQY
ncbi:hypothetical protein VKT23_008407 [Stygiomarasmius scandens]|uniref:RING-type domain-containing protein n=1 Tax=Marasmiellus scandens TaxID=2682957 RepID=A0ABR1JMS6_9AGAR